MRIWFDTEFIECGAKRPMDLLSIGMVREDGAELYLENKTADGSYADDWVRANVIPKLRGTPDVLKSRPDIARAVQKFAGDKPEFWAYYADYDWVILCQLYGKMAFLPEGWPQFCRDFRQLIDVTSFAPRQLSEHVAHDALADARWLRDEHLRFEGMLRGAKDPFAPPAKG